MFILLAIFLLIVAIVIALVKPSSKTQVWLYSIGVPVLLSIIVGFVVASLTSSYYSFSYVVGSTVGSCILPIVISGIALFFCLKSKLEKKEEYKYPMAIIAFIVLSAIIGGLMYFFSYQNDKAVKEFIARDYNFDRVDDGDDDEILQTSENDVDRQVLVEEIEDYNKDLPEYIGNGLTMMECGIENDAVVYTVEWKGIKKSDITSEVIFNLEEVLKDGLKEEIENDVFMKSFFNQMKELGYDLSYRYLDESGKELCTITLSLYDI